MIEYILPEKINDYIEAGVDPKFLERSLGNNCLYAYVDECIRRGLDPVELESYCESLRGKVNTVFQDETLVRLGFKINDVLDDWMFVIINTHGGKPIDTLYSAYILRKYKLLTTGMSNYDKEVVEALAYKGITYYNYRDFVKYAARNVSLVGILTCQGIEEYFKMISDPITLVEIFNERIIGELPEDFVGGRMIWES